MVQTSPKTKGWHGLARIGYEMRANRCTPVETFTQAPLKVQKSLYPEGPAVCHSTLVHTAGGMVAGDLLDVHLDLTPRSQALVTTAAANKVYGSQSAPGAGKLPVASQVVQLSLAPQSCLEWFPQETIVFNKAHFRQQIKVDLAPGAIWCGWDVVRFGRSARGERFTSGEFHNYLAVWQNQAPLWIDHQRLVGGSAPLESLNGLAGYPVIGTFVLVGKTPKVEQLTPLRNLWDGTSPGDVGVTRLQQGLLCRYRGPSSQAARRWFVSVWQKLRPWYLDITATVPRVWGC